MPFRLKSRQSSSSRQSSALTVWKTSDFELRAVGLTGPFNRKRRTPVRPEFGALHWICSWVCVDQLELYKYTSSCSLYIMLYFSIRYFYMHGIWYHSFLVNSTTLHMDPFSVTPLLINYLRCPNFKNMNNSTSSSTFYIYFQEIYFFKSLFSKIYKIFIWITSSSRSSQKRP